MLPLDAQSLLFWIPRNVSCLDSRLSPPGIVEADSAEALGGRPSRIRAGELMSFRETNLRADLGCESFIRITNLVKKGDDVRSDFRLYGVVFAESDEQLYSKVARELKRDLSECDPPPGTAYNGDPLDFDFLDNGRYLIAGITKIPNLQ